MKIRNGAIKYIIAAVQLAMTVAITVVVAVCKPSIGAWEIVLADFIALFGILMILFTEQIAQIRNVMHSIFYRKDGPSEYDEPSIYAVVITKVFGYIALCAQFIFLFI